MSGAETIFFFSMNASPFVQ